MKQLEPNLPSVPEPYRAVNPPLIVDAEYESAPAHVPLAHYLWILRRHCWRMLGFVALVVLCAVVVSLRLTPIYESTATIDIDRRMPNAAIGEESTQSVNNDADQFLATQVKLIQSDSVLRPVVDKFRLREVEPDALEEAVDNSDTSREAPVELKPLRVTRPPNTYILQISYRSKHRQLAADVANAIAQSYLAHSYEIRYKATASLSEFMERQLEELKAKMEKSSAALAQFERELNLINPEEKTSILTARLLELNSEYTKAQADRVSKEAAFNSVQNGSLAAAQASNQGEALKKLTEDLGEAQQKFAEAKTTYGANHPEYKKLQSRVTELETQLDAARKNVARRAQVEYFQAMDRESQLENAVKDTKAEYDGLNARSFEYQTLKGGAEGDKKLYEELVRRIREAGINASFQNSSIRVADLARPGLRPVFPKMWLNVLLAFLFATFFSVGAAVLNDVLDNTVRDPDQVSRLMNAEVIGSLPAVKTWRRHLSPIQGIHVTPSIANGVHVNGNGNVALARAHAESEQALSNYEEAIRTLRNSILLTDFDRRLRSVLLTSASPSEGKSTVAAHLAATHASQHKRTLLIDGDLRRPSVHRLYQVPNSVGLSNVLLEQISWRDAVIRIDDPKGLDVLPAGPSTRRASDLIGMGLAELVEEATREYDLVVLDAPPLLGFAEPLQMATAVDGVIVVARAGDTSRKSLSSVITILTRLRANLVGVVLNEVHREVSPGYYYSYYNRNYYRYYNRPSGQETVR
ncbi:MAG: polysaccharide biosynthesis tyrosine autokinase [Acidobacteriia bacterium]|nr:polysaccharide biosynthesis tyrosine autokinase [Terriglobia bacterium]